jgi:EAL domain-containing protein (putative c-di-GMP-specific phosphodiesterase class I)
MMSPWARALRDRRELAADAAAATGRNELDVHYQIQASASTGAVTGYETLLRWTHPARGSIPPSLFIPIADENGSILDLGPSAVEGAREWAFCSTISERAIRRSRPCAHSRSTRSSSTIVFTPELEGNPQSTAIIRAVVALGRSLSIPVLAEGVESPAQLEVLLREGCDEIQGFLFGRPEPLANLSTARPNLACRTHPDLRHSHAA